MNEPNSPSIYDGLLKDSISLFLREYPKFFWSFSGLLSNINEFVEDFRDLPLEMIWFYGAVAFHSSESASLPPPEKLLLVKELWELLKLCSQLSSVTKKVAVIAPVLYLLYHQVRDPCLREEVGILVEEIVNYMSICCSQYLEEGEHESYRFGVCIFDLIRVWMVDRSGPKHDSDLLSYFFPNLNNDFQKEVIVCMRYMAGVVINEAFLLRLYLKVSPEVSKEDLQKEMLTLAIQTIKGFQNFYFLDMLLKMLLEPSLPVASLLGLEETCILYKALYDAVILMDYSFYYGRWAQSNDGHSKKLALLWVLVADRAINFARAKNDEDRAILYLNAFRESQLMAELIEWASIQAGIVDQNNRVDFTTPNALINWLFVLEEDQGIGIFDYSESLLYAKAISKLESKSPEPGVQGTSGDHEMGDPSGSCSRKRKESESGLQELRDTQVRRVSGHEARLGVSIINNSSDDDMES